MEQNEQNIKMESDTLNLKREYKYAVENLNRIKTDTSEAIATKERVTKEINERNEDLVKIIAEISDAKLNWALERQKQLDEIDEKNAQADNVLKRKGELNEQEESIRKIETKNTEVLNETRRLELKVKQDQAIFETTKKEVEKDRIKIDKEKIKLSKDKEDFKKKVEEVLKSVNEL